VTTRAGSGTTTPSAIFCTSWARARATTSTSRPCTPNHPVWRAARGRYRIGPGQTATSDPPQRPSIAFGALDFLLLFAYPALRLPGRAHPAPAGSGRSGL
jgi:hypothetical protein